MSNKLPGNVVKLTVNLPVGVVRALEDMANDNDVTMTKMLRRCIATEYWLSEQRATGSSFLIKRPSGVTCRVDWKH